MELIHKYYNNFSQAFQDFWKKYHILSTLLIVALLFDTLSTIYFMQQDGIEFELHPLVRTAAMVFGPVSGTILSAFLFRAVAGLLLAVYLRRYSVWILILPMITSTIAGCINFLGYDILPYYAFGQ